MEASHSRAYDRDEKFWSNYLKGRPQAPESFFKLIFDYHTSHGGKFEIAHDIGAGVGPYAPKLKEKFKKVIISDVISGNVEQAKARLGTEGFSFRVSKAEEADDIEPGSVDLVFATNCLHFCDLDKAQEAISRQLKPGGTFLCAGFGIARFFDDKVDEIWARIRQQGGRVLARTNTSSRLRTMARVHRGYDIAPVDEERFLPGAKRIRINWNQTKKSWSGLLPPELVDQVLQEPSRVGSHDEITFEQDASWKFRTNLNGIWQHFQTFAFSQEDPNAFTELWKEMEMEMKDGREVEGWWPANVILATRR
ncbi:hypothetical protein M433DRAFT_432498 [Acidomyces richmondensis BFW]|nr:MAG: hypothetical protein FE78DRAFT_237759 [Acidomyces sp. 'richmondensis']KYG48268.1 hypothetical protein M433DRAFT_432498 [Acidomyces richmondensis BFW]